MRELQDQTSRQMILEVLRLRAAHTPPHPIFLRQPPIRTALRSRMTVGMVALFEADNQRAVDWFLKFRTRCALVAIRRLAQSRSARFRPGNPFVCFHEHMALAERI